MSINLEQDWIRFDGTSANIAYYGYAKPGTDPSTTGWSLRQVVGTNSIVVNWDDNNILSSNAIWNNRVAHFTAPNAPSLTYSITNTINVSWGSTAGVSTYLVSINGGNYSPNGIFPYPNPIRLINKSSYSITNITRGRTYSVVVTASNQAGTSASTVNIYYP
jgi:hypothetical protein